MFIERLWRSVKYEEVYLHGYANGTEARTSLTRYISFYNERRSHQSLEYRTPDDVYFGSTRCVNADGGVTNAIHTRTPRASPARRETALRADD